MSAIEQSGNIQFCVLLYNFPSETLRMIEVACDQAVFEWHELFHDGRASVNDDPRCR
jgi:hypothetical protein